MAAQPNRQMMAILSTRASKAAVSEGIGATGMAMMITRISSAARLTPRVWVNIDKTVG